MRKGKRIAAFLLSLLMASTAVGAFAGCGGDDEEDMEEGFSEVVDGPAPTLALEGTFAVGEKDPALSVTVSEGNSLRAGISKDDVTLTGCFEKLAVSSVEQAEGRLTVHTSGVVVENSSLQGAVTVENAFGTETSCTASADVKTVITYIDPDSYEYTQSYSETGTSHALSFKVISPDPFTARASDATL